MGKRILIIDDNDANREVLGLLFKDEGFEIKLLSGAEDVQSELKEFSPDVVLMDVMMNKSNGAEVCRQIKSSPEFGKIKVLLMTASNAFNTLNTSLTLADGHISKPFDIDEIAQMVDGLLKK